jgi:hypothetical protein
MRGGPGGALVVVVVVVKELPMSYSNVPTYSIMYVSAVLYSRQVGIVVKQPARTSLAAPHPMGIYPCIAFPNADQKPTPSLCATLTCLMCGAARIIHMGKSIRPSLTAAERGEKAGM